LMCVGADDGEDVVTMHNKQTTSEKCFVMRTPFVRQTQAGAVKIALSLEHLTFKVMPARD
jgi:hypothetical protein